MVHWIAASSSPAQPSDLARAGFPGTDASAWASGRRNMAAVRMSTAQHFPLVMRMPMAAVIEHWGKRTWAVPAASSASCVDRRTGDHNQQERLGASGAALACEPCSAQLAWWGAVDGMAYGERIRFYRRRATQSRVARRASSMSSPHSQLRPAISEASGKHWECHHWKRSPLVPADRLLIYLLDVSPLHRPHPASVSLSN